MKIVSYSDLHLEFKHDWRMPSDINADVLVLAGDIILLNDCFPLEQFLKNWQKPVLFVPGNHEYYYNMVDAADGEIKEWLRTLLPQVHFLNNEALTLDGVHFFGGTMWTDFYAGRREYMRVATEQMSDFQLIVCEKKRLFTPQDSVKLHKKFVLALKEWFATVPEGPRVVITHHAPMADPQTKYVGSPLSPAFVCTDMQPLIENFQPDVWIYGHTHECGVHTVGKTRLISNQLGYIKKQGGYECHEGFDRYGCVITL